MCCGVSYKPAKRPGGVNQIKRPVTPPASIPNTKPPSQEPAEPPVVNSPANPNPIRGRGYRLTG